MFKFVEEKTVHELIWCCQSSIAKEKYKLEDGENFH